MHHFADQPVRRFHTDRPPHGSLSYLRFYEFNGTRAVESLVASVGDA
jgi:hypothetical protein